MQDDFYARCAAAFAKRLGRHISDHVRQDSVLGLIPHVEHVHGPGLLIHQEGGTVDQSAHARHEAAFCMDRKVIESGDSVAFLAEVASGAHELRASIAKAFFAKLDEACEASGNVVDVGGQPLTPDVLYEMFRKIELSFDGGGHPVMPTIVCHPSAEPEIRRVLDMPGTMDRILDILEQRRRQRFGS